MVAVPSLLKEPSATKLTPTFGFLNFDGQRVQVHGLPDNGTLNDALELAEQQLLDCYRTHRVHGLLPDAEALRAAVVLVLLAQLLASDLWPVTNHVPNRYLKELSERAAPVEVVRHRPGSRESEMLAKWERLGCHTGRRTFATLALEQGLRPELVMKITGHKSWASFKRYVNITADVVSKEFHRVYGGGGESL